MMYGYGSGMGHFAWLHMFGGLLGLAFLFGIAFFLAWAIKTLKKDDLLKWGILLVVISMIGWILMASLGGFWSKNSFGHSCDKAKFGPGMMWGAFDADDR